MGKIGNGLEQTYDGPVGYEPGGVVAYGKECIGKVVTLDARVCTQGCTNSAGRLEPHPGAFPISCQYPMPSIGQVGAPYKQIVPVAIQGIRIKDIGKTVSEGFLPREAVADRLDLPVFRHEQGALAVHGEPREKRTDFRVKPQIKKMDAGPQINVVFPRTFRGCSASAE